MWIGSLKSNEEKPFGIKWPSEPIKALGVFFTYDQTLLYEKNFRDKLDKMKKLTNIWSSRGLSIYGKVTIIKSLLIPKLVYASSLFPTPAKIIKQAEHIIYTFLWKGKDKVTRLSAINNFEGGGIKMIDIESMVKALRLAWLKRIFNDNESTWKTYLLYLLKDFGGSLIFECNYTMKDLSIISIFYRELLQWWSEFRDHFSDEKYWLSIIWNHKDIRINGKPVFYKTYYNSGIEKYYFTISKLFKILNLQDIIIGITASSCPLLNYLILIGKIYIWDCRRKGVRPNLEGFKFKIKIKYQTEKYIATKNNDLETFYRK